MKNLKQLFYEISYQLDASRKDHLKASIVQKDKQKKLLQAINQANNEWHSAKSFFENATDPDLVDYAIFSMEASERKYVYLLKEAKKSGLKINHQDNELSKDIKGGKMNE